MDMIWSEELSTVFTFFFCIRNRTSESAGVNSVRKELSMKYSLCKRQH